MEQHLASSYRRPRRFIFWSLADYLVLGIVLLGVLLFILYPIVSVLSTSFFDQGTFTLKYYEDLFSAKNIHLIKNSLWVATLSSCLVTVIALCIALYAFVSKGKRHSFMRSSLMLTMISPPFVSALAFITLFGRRGLITHGLLGLSVNPYGWQGIVILQTIGSISFATLMLITSLDAIDSRQILASRDLGASPFETIMHVVLPSIRPGILSVVFILFTMNLADFGTPVVIGGNYQVLATEAYMQVISSANLGKASAISVLMVPPAIVAFYFYRKSMAHASNQADGSKSFSDSPYSLELSKPIRFMLGSIVVLFFVVMLLKYGNILLSTVTNTASGSLQFTTRYFHDLPRSQWSSFRHSIIYSLVAAASASFLGILLSYYAHRRKLRGMQAVEFCASLPYIIPGTFFGLGYVAAFSHAPIILRGTAWIIILNYTFRQLSVSNKSANAAFTTMDEQLELAARDLGASHMQILRDIVLPMMAPTFLTCFITIFTASMTAVGAIVFLVSPGKNVASAELFKSIANGRYGVAAVQAVCIIAVTITFNLFSMYLLKRSRRGHKGGSHVFTTG